MNKQILNILGIYVTMGRAAARVTLGLFPPCPDPTEKRLGNGVTIYHFLSIFLIPFTGPIIATGVIPPPSTVFVQLSHNPLECATLSRQMRFLTWF